MTDPTSGPRFSLGDIVVTDGVVEAIAPEDVVTVLARHAAGDWGDLHEEDRLANEQSLEQGGGLFSAYRFADKVEVWVITEGDRSLTTVLLPEEH